MRAIRVGDIVEATGGTLAAGQAASPVGGVSTDSRTIRSGEAFFALVGERFNGHEFLSAVTDAGASAVVISEGTASGRLSEYRGAVIVVADTQRALGDLAAWYRRGLECRVIAITGSCGKTTVKEMLGQVLETSLKGHRPESSFNNSVGVPLTILKSEPGDDYLVLELGTSGPGEMRRLAEIAGPDIAVVTCVAETHLEGLKSLEGVAQEKEQLVQALVPDGLAVLNWDDRRVRAMAEATRAHVLTFGVTGGDVVGRDVQVGPAEVSFVLDSEVEIRVPTPGRHNVTNALATVAAAREMGLSDETIARALGRYRPAKMRLVREELAGGVTLIDDAYNANPASMAAALEVLCSQRTSGRRVMVAGDMLELGEQSQSLHAAFGHAAAESCVNLLVTVGERMKAATLAAAERAELMRLHFPDSRAASGEVADSLESGDVVLVKGSRGSAMEVVVGAIRKRFGGESAAREG